MEGEKPIFSWSWGENGVDSARTLRPDPFYMSHSVPSYAYAKERFRQRHSSRRRISNRRPSLVLQRTATNKQWWKFTLRPWDDDEDQDWWFASTAIPLLAAALGPLANVLSIAALVTSWRMCLVNGVSKDGAEQCDYNGNPNSLGADLDGQPFSDPRWCYLLNIVSLIVGFVGNFFLLCNFTGRIRYIVALPMSILMWYIATGILIGITAGMHLYKPPIGPQQTYTQGFWYAVIAACMYCLCSMLLMVNMLGYFLGHYPQHFALTDSQRTLILQTMLFFFWLAGGAALFNHVEKKFGGRDGQQWGYVNALYFCDVTILTVGFGDLYPTNDVARGLNFPYAVGGIIMLGLMVSSISKFATELGSDNIIRKHVETSRARTVGRAVTTSLELEHQHTLIPGEIPVISAPMQLVDRSKQTAIDFAPMNDNASEQPERKSRVNTLKRVATMVTPRQKTPKLILLREEKDRFDAMRRIQMDTNKFKRWYALSLSITAFGLLWCGGAAVLWRCEREAQEMTYFRALYFCYVSLLTIGYGDLAPVTNAGRPFFVLWSLIAVPTMTILVSDLGDTVINKFKHGTYKLADFTVLPKTGAWRGFLESHPKLWDWLVQRKQEREAKRRLEEGFQAGPEPEPEVPPPTIEELAKDEPSDQELALRLGKKIKETAHVMNNEPHKRYSYEDWVELTQLIRFTARNPHNGEMNGVEEEGLIEWDWIGEDSPMMSKSSEPEFVFDRLCESMTRYIKKKFMAPLSEESPNLRRQVEDDDSEETDVSGSKEIRKVSLEGVDPLDKSARPTEIDKAGD